MSRHGRRFTVRLRNLAFTGLLTSIVYYRWQWRKGAVLPPPSPPSSPLSRAERFSRLGSPMRSSPLHSAPATTSPQDSNPNPKEMWDVLVVGGGLTGLCTALEAAQRGLRVTLVEAQDLSSGFTSHSPGLTPGPIPYLQRAVRQRESAWLWEALAALGRRRVWSNVTGAQLSSTSSSSSSSSSERVGMMEERIAVVAPHLTELVELSVVGWLATLLSPLFGPLQVHCNWLSRKTLAPPRPMPAAGDGSAEMDDTIDEVVPPRGAVISKDLLLDGPTLAVRVARTAEALGVNIVTYAPLVALSLERKPEGTSSTGTESVTARGQTPSPSHSAQKDEKEMKEEIYFRATVTDLIGKPSSSATTYPQYEVLAKSVINCTGAWADEVRDLLLENQSDPLPRVFDRSKQFQVQSFLVAPRSAVMRRVPPQSPSTTTTTTEGAVASSRAEGDCNHDGAESVLEALGVDGLHTVPTRYSFSSALVLPWADDCVVLGPSYSLLPTLPSFTNKRSEATSSHVLHASDGYASVAARVVDALKESGMVVDPSQLLTCLSSWTPTYLPAAEIPWLSSYFFKNFHIAVSTLGATPELESLEEHSPERTISHRQASPLMETVRPTKTESAGSSSFVAVGYDPSASLPFIHVYGGLPVQARDIAVEAIDTLTSLPRSSATLRAASGPGRRPHPITLLPLPWEEDPADGGDASEKIVAMVRAGYAERVTDVLFRRLHIAYTSPGSAMAAVPVIASVMGAELGWSAARIKLEVERATREIQSVAVLKR